MECIQGLSVQSLTHLNPFLSLALLPSLHLPPFLSVCRLFGVTGSCAACSKLIPAFEMVMRARDNVYHLDCFACQLCSHRCDWGSISVDVSWSCMNELISLRRIHLEIMVDTGCRYNS